ncbi:MAG TPA: DoxX family membrane protein [Candidatus Acidoferrales bacterium]|nr:DoxX family membrane protein [Candidatus Acidoferrales bacterium]
MQIGSLAIDRNDVALAFLRIFVGFLFIMFGQYKVFGTQFIFGGGFESYIDGFIAHGAYPFMVPLLKNFVLAHHIAVAYLVSYGEMAIGLGLVLGILVRTAGVFGCIFMLAMLFSSNYPGANVPLWRYFGASLQTNVLAMRFAAFVIGEADRVLSLWRYLRKRGKPGK